VFEQSIKHPTEEIMAYAHIIDQYPFRKQTILDALAEAGIDLAGLSAVVGRGGMLKPIESGTFEVNDAMVDYMRNATRGEHASNLGCVLAKDIADRYGIPSFIVDPVAVDGALLSGQQHRLHQLVALERLALAIGLDDVEIAQLHPLERGEARATGRALPAPADGPAILGGTGVLHLGVMMTAKRAAHGSASASYPSSG
jgi:butyrate kinase